MTKAFLNTFGLGMCLVFFLLWLNGYAWEPLAVIVIAVAIIAAGTPAQWPSRGQEREVYPPRIGAAPGDQWWMHTDSIPLPAPETADLPTQPFDIPRRGRHA